MLCVALLFVFGQASVASAVAQVEHLFVGSHPHHHMLFTDMTIDAHSFDHDHDRSADGHHGSGIPLDETGHHHHHGDLGSNSLLVVETYSAVPALHEADVTLPQERVTIRARHNLPDRPPRA
jgi:hypothetical protein